LWSAKTASQLLGASPAASRPAPLKRLDPLELARIITQHKLHQSTSTTTFLLDLTGIMSPYCNATVLHHRICVPVPAEVMLSIWAVTLRGVEVTTTAQRGSLHTGKNPESFHNNPHPS
jgi:hypothetical protein